MVPPRRSGVLAASLLTAVLVLAPSAPASAGAPTERLRDFFAGVNAIVADRMLEEQPLEKIVRVRRLVTDVTDMNTASAVALGAAWIARTPAERREFIALFADLLERAYVGRLAGAVRVTGRVVMTYLDESLTDDGATVQTALRGLGGHDMRVEYRMTRLGERWRVRDIVLDGVSTVENYHAQFRRLLQQDSYAALLTGIRAKLAEDSLMFAALERRVPTAPTTPVIESDITIPPREPDVVAPARKPAPRVKPVRAVNIVERPAAMAVALPAPVVVTPIAPGPSPVAVALPAPLTVAPADKPNALLITLGALLLGVAVVSGAVYLRRR